MNNDGIICHYRNVYNNMDYWKRKMLIISTSAYIYRISKYLFVNINWFLDNIFLGIFWFFILPLGFTFLLKMVNSFVLLFCNQNQNLIHDHNIDIQCKLLFMDNNTIKNKIIDTHTYVESSNDICDLCMGNYINIILKCHSSHTSCMNCIIEWCKKDNSCPYCRVKIIEVKK